MEAGRSAEVNWRFCAVAGLVLLIGALGLSVGTGLWVYSAVAVGLLFGFLLQKGDLCGASAFSEVIVMGDTAKLWGLWVCIVTGMIGFAVLDQLALVQLNPKPFVWMNYVVGGLVFGIGMVLAGGCVSGSLFKAGNGHLTSLAALPGIALGVALVEHGPLSSLNRSMKSYVVKASDGGPVTLSSLTGLPFWLLALLMGLLTVAFAVGRRRPKRTQGGPGSEGTSIGLDLRRIVTVRHWKPWHAGIAIGILGSLAYLSSASSGRNYPLGVTHGVYHAQLLMTETDLTHVWRKAPPASPVGEARSVSQAIPPSGRKKVSWWLIAEVLGIVVGAWLAGRAGGEARLLAKPPEQVVTAFVGGCLVGVGAGFAKGCVVGNILSGWALMSLGTVVFGIVTILANWATTWVYLMGAPTSKGQ